MSNGASAKTVVGTPGYIAPEIFENQKTGYSFAVDIWSFGMLLYELLTLQRPFEFEMNDGTLRSKSESGALPDLPSKLPEEYDGLIKLWKTCVSVTPEKRPTIKECISSLQKIAGSIRSSTRNERQRKFKKKNGSLDLTQFSVLSKIGQGGFGDVFLVRKIEDFSVLCMKRMDKARYHQKNDMRRAEMERNVLVATTESPFIIRLDSAFQDNNFMYLLMEYAPGGDLRSVLELNPNGLEVEYALFYFCEMLLAIEDLHKAHYLHRDLKPENFVIDKHGHLKLIDFGLSSEAIEVQYSQLYESIKESVSSPIQIEKKKRKKNGGSKKISQKKTVSEPTGMSQPSEKIQKRRNFSKVGSPDYVAPEVIRGEGNNTCDVWSLGINFFELLFGYPPFNADTPAETLRNVLNFESILPVVVKAECDDPLLSDLFECIFSVSKTRISIPDLKKHKYFAKTDWDKVYLKKLEPPFAPILQDELDTSYFSSFEGELQLSPQTLRERHPEISCSDLNVQNFTFKKKKSKTRL